MTALADDLTGYIAVRTPIEEIPDGAEVDLGTGWLERVTDTETAAEREHGDHGDLIHVVTLHYEDMAGEPCTYTRPRGTEVTYLMPIHSGPREYSEAEKAAARAHMETHPEMYGPWEWPDALQSSAFMSLPASTRAAINALTEEPPPLPDGAVTALARTLGAAARRQRAETGKAA